MYFYYINLIHSHIFTCLVLNIKELNSNDPNFVKRVSDFIKLDLFKQIKSLKRSKYFSDAYLKHSSFDLEPAKNRAETFETIMRFKDKLSDRERKDMESYKKFYDKSQKLVKSAEDFFRKTNTTTATKIE